MFVAKIVVKLLKRYHKRNQFNQCKLFSLFEMFLIEKYSLFVSKVKEIRTLNHDCQMIYLREKKDFIWMKQSLELVSASYTRAEYFNDGMTFLQVLEHSIT